MNEQVTIIAMIDIRAALNANSLEENIYLIDNLQKKGSEGSGTNDLTTLIKGSYWCDGSQSCDIVLNWLTGGLNSLPPTLPRKYVFKRSEQIDREWLQTFKNFHQNPNSGKQDFSPDFNKTIKNIGEFDKIKDNHERINDLAIKPLNRFGELFDDGENVDNLSFLPPQITDITGEAVDKGVIFPAQYGTPVAIKDGWYWSATVDTSKTGTFSYTLHIVLYTRKGNFWIPVEMTHEAKIRVISEPQKNGFTNAGMGFLPLV